MVTTQDRISRDDMHWWTFVGWVLEHDKHILVLDDPSLNIRDEDGRMIAGIKATQAAKYRKSVQQKRLDQTKYYREQRLFPGGTWPFGYRAVRVEHNGSPRWRLSIDPVTGPLVREAYDRVVNQQHSLGRIAKDWNARGVLSTLDYQRHVNAVEGREGVKTEVKGTKWATSTMTAVLTKPSLMGYAMHKGTVLKEHGLPVVWADPLLTREEWDKLQAALESRARGKGQSARATTPLVGIVFCKCGAKMYSNSSKKKTKDQTTQYHYYMCSTWSNAQVEKCDWVISWPKNILEDILDDRFLDAVGDVEIAERTFIPGVDRSSQIKELREALDNLTGSLAAAKPGSAVANAVMRAMEEHEQAITELESIPVIPSRWHEQGTGKTHGEAWKSSDWDARGELLRNSGIRLYLSGGPKAPICNLFIPEDLAKQLSNVYARIIDSEFLEGWHKTIEEAIEENLKLREKYFPTQGRRRYIGWVTTYEPDDE